MSSILGNPITLGDANKSFSSNPNLLDNWYFGNPVNQRGAKDGDTVTNAYGFDRWKCMNIVHLIVDNTDGKISVGFKNDGVSRVPHLRQYLENDWEIGTTYTLSALVKGKGQLALGQSTKSFDTENEWKIISATTKPNSEFQNFKYVQFTPIGDYGYDFLCRAIKLEFGSQQTLAHQENGVWVLNEIPDYGEQLLRCQRYYHVYGSASARPANMYDCVPTMRATPVQGTITVDGTTLYYNEADL